jgi:hypothetical protein
MEKVICFMLAPLMESSAMNSNAEIEKSGENKSERERMAIKISQP